MDSSDFKSNESFFIKDSLDQKSRFGFAERNAKSVLRSKICFSIHRNEHTLKLYKCLKFDLVWSENVALKCTEQKMCVVYINHNNTIAFHCSIHEGDLSKNILCLPYDKILQVFKIPFGILTAAIAPG